MINDTIYIEWTNFLNDNKELFFDRIEIWLNTLTNLKNFININKKTVR